MPRAAATSPPHGSAGISSAWCSWTRRARSRRSPPCSARASSRRGWCRRSLRRRSGPRPSETPMRARIPSRPTLACIGLCALILAAATADLVHTESHLPDVTPACQPDTPTCRNAKLSEQLARDRAAEPLQDQYDSRAWLYVPAILAVVGVATAWGLRTRPRSAWPQVFTNLGVIGVWLGIAAIALLLATDGSSLAPPPAPT